jgi:hypothetical protein
LPTGVHLEIVKKKLSDLNPAEYNPRLDLKPGDPDYEKLKRSIEQFGSVDPIIWNKRTKNIVGGHQRFKILLDMGVKETEVSVVDLDDKQERLLNVALNKISGDWDYPKLKDLIADIDTGEFDITLTGFDSLELEEMFGIVGPDPLGFSDEDGNGMVKIIIEVMPECWSIDSMDIIDKLKELQKIYKKKNFTYKINE